MKNPRPKYRTTLEFSQENWDHLSRLIKETGKSRNQVVNDLVRENMKKRKRGD